MGMVAGWFGNGVDLPEAHLTSNVFRLPQTNSKARCDYPNRPHSRTPANTEGGSAARSSNAILATDPQRYVLPPQ